MVKSKLGQPSKKRESDQLLKSKYLKTTRTTIVQEQATLTIYDSLHMYLLSLHVCFVSSLSICAFVYVYIYIHIYMQNYEIYRGSPIQSAAHLGGLRTLKAEGALAPKA